MTQMTRLMSVLALTQVVLCATPSNARAQKSSTSVRRDPVLQEVVDRMELRDLMNRYAKAVDARDKELLRGVVTPDIDFNLNEGEVAFVGYDGYLNMLKSTWMNHATMHFMGNQTVEFHGSDSASMETYANAHHIHIGPDGKWTDSLSGLRYLDEVIRVDGHWKVRKRVMIRVFHQEIPVPDPAAPRTANRSGR
jgi:hypothetical protein